MDEPLYAWLMPNGEIIPAPDYDTAVRVAHQINTELSYFRPDPPVYDLVRDVEVITWPGTPDEHQQVLEDPYQEKWT